MKKFLCYDTNDAASRKINVNTNGVLSPNATIPSTNGSAYQQLVTDGNGKTKWEDRLAYEYTEWKDFTLSSDSHLDFTGFTMPSVGDTVTVKVNGVESVETVKSGEMRGLSYTYIGSVDMAGYVSGTNGWLVAYIPGEGILSGANPETTISLLVTYQHKIDEKYIPQDKNFVRPLSYYIGNDGDVANKLYYNESGDVLFANKRSNIIMPKENESTFIYDNGDIGIGQFGSMKFSSFVVYVYKFTEGVMRNRYEIYGTNETEFAELAASYGYTLTTKPTI